MKKGFFAALAASSLVACTSIETATVSSTEIAAQGGEPIAVIQGNSIGLTAIFHLIDIVPSDLDVTVNRLIVSEAKAMGASRVDLKTARTTPRHGIFAILTSWPWIIGFPQSESVGVAVK